MGLVSGQAVSYTNWASGQPNNDDDCYDWARTMSSSDGQWYGLRTSTDVSVGLIELDGAGTGGTGAGPWAQYLLDVDVADLIPPTVTAVSPLPAAGGSTSRWWTS